MSARQWRIRYATGMVIGFALMLVYLFGTGRLTSVWDAMTLIAFTVLLLALALPLVLAIRRLTRFWFGQPQ